ncbi:hypothetical protein HJG60_011500 [Phyllostomus discolor]|uniref:Uncharacterized protein n=1 Tax=Phyllostomus discolor TaxID=89673 RepID=A0A833ZMU7_9CHIR|nr:hypothetical protein HJG60_011500 [Phyllostomus discolor]
MSCIFVFKGEQYVTLNLNARLNIATNTEPIFFFYFGKAKKNGREGWAKKIKVKTYLPTLISSIHQTSEMLKRVLAPNCFNLDPLSRLIEERAVTNGSVCMGLLWIITSSMLICHMHHCVGVTVWSIPVPLTEFPEGRG